MRAANITNGVVADLWEVNSLDAYASAGIELILAPDNVGMGDSYSNGVFTPKVIPPLTIAQQNAIIITKMAALEHKILCKLCDADPEYAALKKELR